LEKGGIQIKAAGTTNGFNTLAHDDQSPFKYAKKLSNLWNLELVVFEQGDH